MTNATGTVQQESTYYPFGGERVYLDTCGSHHKFTGKERDAEADLDCFGARYFGSKLGRFTRRDSKGIELRHPLNPQKLNKSLHGLNNPLSCP